MLVLISKSNLFATMPLAPLPKLYSNRWLHRKQKYGCRRAREKYGEEKRENVWVNYEDSDVNVDIQLYMTTADRLFCYIMILQSG